MFDPVPWFVGGGALHSPEIARTFAYAATSGAEGVGGGSDLRVSALATPGTSVRVAVGSALILNRSTSSGQQTYAARNATETTVGVTAQGASGTRYDLVVARVEDPFVSGNPWANPTDVTQGPYVFARVIPNVTQAQATTRSGARAYLASQGLSAIPLAGITIPPSTATITGSMLTDLRTVAISRRSRDLYNTQPTASSNATSSSWADWTPQANRSIEIPPWATQAKVVVTVAGAVCRTSSAYGYVGFTLGSLGTQASGWDMDTNTRATLVASDTLAIPAAMRGTTQTLKMRAYRAGGSGTMQTDTSSTVLFDVEFLEVASAD